jgi:hypothetical protein
MPNEGSKLPVSSSTPPAFSPEALECYRGVLQALQAEKIPFTIAGAFALHKHTGIWRSTKDLDIMLEAKSVPNALRRLDEMGFETRIEDPVWLAKAMCGEYFVDLITAMGNAALIIDARWIEKAVPYEIFGVPCRVLSAEEFVASKVFITRRERFDGADLAHIIRACGDRIDWNRVLQILGPHWELLFWSLIFFAYVYPAHVGLVPEKIWSELTRRFEEHIYHPKLDEPFRGTLIDPFMFAIDVAEWGERDLYREYCERHPLLLRSIDSKYRSRG